MNNTTLSSQWTGVATIYTVPDYWLNMAKDKEVFRIKATCHGARAMWLGHSSLLIFAASHEDVSKAKERVEELGRKLEIARNMQDTMALLK